MTLVLSILWFFRETKSLLFYFYLWQLKEYQVFRFLDHFSTEKGKRILLNKMSIIKYAVFILFFLIIVFFRIAKRQELIAFLSWAVLIIYFVEFLHLFKNIFKIKFPVLTKKALVLLFFGLIFEIVIIIIFYKSYSFAFWLLFFDIFLILFSSLIVFIIQLFVVYFRNKILKKAKEKIAKNKKLIVIGVTGSYGKTSTKEFLAEMLSLKFNVLKTKEHQNSEIGIANCILQDLKEEHDIFVVEMASYAKGGIKMLSDIIKPKIGVVTGVNQQHLSLYRTMDNLISAEGGVELLKSLPLQGKAFLNGDNDILAEKVSPIFANTILCNTKKEQGFFAKDIKVEKGSVSFKVDYFDFRFNVAGGYNVQNLLLAIAVSKELGMSFEEISKANITQGAMKIFNGKEGINILDASYSSNPDGVIADLDYLNIYQKQKVIVMPCLIELGQASGQVHYEIGKKIGKVCNFAIITTKDQISEIKRGTIEAGLEDKNIVFAEADQDIISRIKMFLGEGDAVLFEGRIKKEIIEELK